MTRTLTLYVNILLGLIVLATVVFAFPYAASAFLLYQGAGDLERALQEQGMELDPSGIASLEASQLRAASFDSQLLMQSVDRLEHAIKWDAKNAKAYRFLAEAISLQGDYIAAARVLAGLATVEPDNWTTVTSFRILYEAASEDQRQEMLDFWRGIPGAGLALLRQGDRSFRDGQADEALGLFQAALKIDPRLARVYYRIGKVYQSREMIDEALEAYQQAVDLGAFGQDALQELADTHSRIGGILSKRDEWDRAAREYETALAIEPEHSPSLVGLGAIQFHQGDLTQSRRSFNRALSSNPNNAWAYYWLGRLNYEEGLFSEAISEFQEAIRLNPDKPWFYFYLGEAHRQVQQIDLATAQYERVLELDPQNSLAEQHLREIRP